MNGVKVKCDSNKKGLKILTLYLFADFYRNYILINDIILIHELVGDEIINEKFSNANNCAHHERDFACRNSISAYKYFLMEFFFQFFTRCRWGVRRILHDWLKVTKYHSSHFLALYQPSWTRRKYREKMKGKSLCYTDYQSENDDSFGNERRFLKYSPGKEHNKYEWRLLRW